MTRQPFHLVEYSPWPLTAAFGAMLLTWGMTSWFHLNNLLIMNLGIFVILLTMIQWWRDVIRESTYQGFHTTMVMFSMRWGMILFIISEIMFFFAFFWAFFQSSLAPTMELGCIWPPSGTLPLNPFAIPLLNTAVLLASGVSVTWAHHALMENNLMSFMYALMITIYLGFYFTFLQMMEYMETEFTISDSVFGSVFFVATGFHGLHVIIGSTFLFICFMRGLLNQYSIKHHFGFEAAAWYWHFVDVIWIFLYFNIYWWGS
uniref:Cytochrome c oxidase subunit 3 n=1 Tax=Gesiella jameensis TaxID=1960709 RepID=A0A8E7IWX4_9ANNE|nr:cytochrome c oxidase subunit 3 [Gesiella jameensis]